MVSRISGMWSRSEFVGSDRRPVELGILLGAGREGGVFEVCQSTMVAKIFSAPNRTTERLHKVRLMVAHPPKDPTEALGHVSICWPVELVFQRSGMFAGFLMPRVDTANCPQLLKFVLPKYYPPIFSWRNQIEIAANLAGALSALHEAGYVVGDLNLKNIHVTRSCLVTSVDCDSFQVRDPSDGRVLRSLVGMPEYTAPEFQGMDFAQSDRTEASDVFAFAVICCHLLLGTHPFAGGRGQTWEENIARNDCLLLTGAIPRGSPSPELLPPPLHALLSRCFRDGFANPSERPRMQEFAQALADARENVATCADEPERHAFSNHLSDCPWCNHRLVYGFDPYRRPPPKPRPVPVQVQLPPEPAFPQIPVRQRWWPRAHVLLVLAFLLLLAAGAGFVWNILRTEMDAISIPPGKRNAPLDFREGVSRSLSQLRQKLQAVFANSARHAAPPPSAPQSQAEKPAPPPPVPAPLSVGPIVICQGTDAKGNPAGAGRVFAASGLVGKPLSAYIRFENAVPGKTQFEVRWSASGSTAALSRSYSPADKSGVLLVHYRDPLSLGAHTVRLLVDGAAQRTTTFEVVASPAAQVPASATHQPAIPEVSIAPPTRAAEQREIRKPRLAFYAKHYHGIGSCRGEMVLEPDSISFTSESHSFQWTRWTVELHEDGLQDDAGHRWHFELEGADVREVLRRWMRGELEFR